MKYFAQFSPPPPPLRLLVCSIACRNLLSVSPFDHPPLIAVLLHCCLAALHCSKVQCYSLRCIVALYIVFFLTLQCSAMDCCRCSALQCSVVQCSAVWCCLCSGAVYWKSFSVEYCCAVHVQWCVKDIMTGLSGTIRKFPNLLNIDPEVCSLQWVVLRKLVGSMVHFSAHC